MNLSFLKVEKAHDVLNDIGLIRLSVQFGVERRIDVIFSEQMDEKTVARCFNDLAEKIAQ
jgi:hypothetical protein